MASKSLFSSNVSATTSNPTNTVNAAGGKAYALTDKLALTQLVMTGCFNNTFYTSDKDQLDMVLKLAQNVDVNYLAKLAVHARKSGFMKDSPALLAAIVSSRAPALLGKIFSRVIDDPKMLRNFVQIVRSGVTGRKSLGTAPKRLIKNYLDSMTDEQLFKANIGNDPSLVDIIKLTHPKPTTASRAALYSYLLDKEYDANQLPQLVKDFEMFKKNNSLGLPSVPFQMLTALPLTDAHWKDIAKNATWTQTRMNLNTFARHNVFKDSSMVKLVASRINDRETVERTKVFPYQLFAAFMNIDAGVPVEISNALQHAADYALKNVPELEGKVFVAVDTSGSMGSPVTGYASRGPSSKVRCVDAAALFASAIMKNNPTAEVIPFDTRAHTHNINPMDSIMSNARKLASFGGGSTDCSIPLRELNAKNAKGDLVVYVSDNESFMDEQHHRQTATMKEWDIFKKRNPNAKLVNIDIQPYSTTQVHEREDILNIGGFNDSIFEVIANFIKFGNDKESWFSNIGAVNL